MAIRGIVDSCDAVAVRGWAWDVGRPSEPLTLEITIDDQPVATITADLFGSDLALAGIGDGRHRFDAGIAHLLPSSGRHTVAVKHEGRHLENSPVLVTVSALDALAAVPLRDVLAARFIAGDGIEIGALNRPQWVPDTARVTYVDRFTTEQLAAYFPQLDPAGIVPVGSIDDGETLAGFADASVDFIIANNFLEHCEDTVGTLLSFLRVLRDGGVMLVAVPSRRANVDHHRPPTRIEEFIADHEVGPHVSRAEAYRDWVHHVLRETGSGADTRIAELQASRYSIHFHVYTELEVMSLVRLLSERYHHDLVVEAVVNDRSLEVTLALRKGSEVGLSGLPTLDGHDQATQDGSVG